MTKIKDIIDTNHRTSLYFCAFPKHSEMKEVQNADNYLSEKIRAASSEEFNEVSKEVFDKATKIRNEANDYDSEQLISFTFLAYRAATNCLKIIKDILSEKKELNNKIARVQGEKNSLERERDNLREKNGKLDREIRDLRNEKKEKEEKLEKEVKELKEKLAQEQRERQREKTEYNNKELAWEREKGQKDAEISRLGEKSRNDDTRKMELTGEVEDKKKEIRDKNNEIGRLEIKLDEKVVRIQGLTDQLTNLQLEGNNKDNELRNKDDEIRRKDEEITLLKRWVGLSREELLSERIDLKYSKLEIFANQIGINLQQVSALCRYCERLIYARKSGNQANIETHEDNITRVREGLRQEGIQIGNIQKFCRKCEKIAKLRVELNEIRQQQQQQQQYEARQGVPPLNNNRIG